MQEIQSLKKNQKGYPPLLKEIPGCPERLYFRGDLRSLEPPLISIVGSRTMSSYGKRVLNTLIPDLVQAGFGLVSGLAYGIDGEVHRLAVARGGRCIAVLGNGLDSIYPLQHRSLAENILEQRGCLLSELTPGTPPLKHHFPLRNRIIAGLSPLTLVIEAAEQSGTLITAHAAINAGRTVGVVPGDIFSPNTAGILTLLKEGAQPIQNLTDILAFYQYPETVLVQERLRPALTGTAASLYHLVSQGYDTVDSLLVAAELNMTQVQAALSLLELDGYITCNGGKWQKIL